MPKAAVAAILSALVLLAAAALAGPHLVVSTRLLRSWVNDNPNKLLLEYDAASSWVPGVVVVKGLRFRGQDPNVEWYFHMDEARISVSLVDLLAKRFHATKVESRGLTFRLRERVDKSELSRPHAALVPSIPGFSDPALKDEGPEPKEPAGKLWGVQIDRIVADPTQEIWIELYRFRGHARVAGRFSLQPRVRAAVGPAAVEFLSGEVTLGEEKILATAAGRADCTIEPYDPSRVEGNQVWPRISGGFRIGGKTSGVEFLNYFLRNSPEPRLEGGRGTSSADLRLEHGIARGRVDLAARDLAARYSDAVIRGTVAVRARVRRWDFQHDSIDLGGTHLSLSNVISTGKRQDSRDWWGRFNLGAAEVRRGLRAHLEAECRDARPLFRLFNVELPGWAQGVLKLDGLIARAHATLAPETVEVIGLDASGGKFHIAGNYREKGANRRGAFLVETGPLALGIDIEGSKSKLKVIGAKKWFEEQEQAAKTAQKSQRSAP